MKKALLIFIFILPYFVYSVEPSKAFVKLAKIVRSSVVNISTTKTGSSNMIQIFPGYVVPFTAPDMTASGSGFIVDKKGLIITNAHVVRTFDKIQVQFSGDDKNYLAEVLGADSQSDIALIKVNVNKNLKPVILGDSSKLEVGEWVAAIGNPHGYGHTMTKGIISAVKREIDDLNLFPLLQTDASINPGNSGGPLVNLKGEVVGVNQAIVRGATGISFAIPINNVKEVLKDLKSFGFVRRAFIGVHFQADGEKGAVVSYVVPGGPAEKAGLKNQDRIISFAGKEINQARDLPKAVRKAKIGEKTSIKVMRNNRILALGIRPQILKENQTVYQKGQPSDKKGQDIFGQFQLIDPSPAHLKAFGHPGWTKHPIVINLKSNSMAFNFGLRNYDMLFKVDGVVITTVREAKRRIKKGRAYNLQVLRYDHMSDRYSIQFIRVSF
ncbi:MAG: trypsin-like peptidase domain-containing protein [Bdellovibrionaceae bacterium]|nr:trypsin-like peptidase domain-containing protein [Pseudobdellovibrionaceae bacterium]